MKPNTKRIIAVVAGLTLLGGALGVAVDEYRSYPPGNAPTGAAENGFNITPSDEDDLAYTTRGLYVGTGGTIVATFAGGGEVTLTNVGDGTQWPWRLVHIDSTGTTATGLVGLR